MCGLGPRLRPQSTLRNAVGCIAHTSLLPQGSRTLPRGLPLLLHSTDSQYKEDITITKAAESQQQRQPTSDEYSYGLGSTTYLSTQNHSKSRSICRQTALISTTIPSTRTKNWFGILGGQSDLEYERSSTNHLGKSLCLSIIAYLSAPHLGPLPATRTYGSSSPPNKVTTPALRSPVQVSTPVQRVQCTKSALPKHTHCTTHFCSALFPSPSFRSSFLAIIRLCFSIYSSFCHPAPAPQPSPCLINH